MSCMNLTRLIVLVIATLALAGCVSDPNNLNKRAGLTKQVSSNHLS